MALFPLIFFLVFYLGGSLLLGDFYKIPITVAFLATAIVAILCGKGKLSARIERFSQGAADKNILLMVWIFVMAGAFANGAKAIGAVDATVGLTLELLPSGWVLVGLFLAACFVSLAVGTSVGTIVALTPIAAGVAEQTGGDVALTVAIVAGGSFFGDNLSFISDTTIAATQLMGCRMNEKFKANLRIALPAAVVAVVIYFFMGMDVDAPVASVDVDGAKVLPYIAVIILALTGMNVMVVLLIGILLCAIVGIATDTVDFYGFIAAMGEGIEGMGQLIIVTLLAGGVLKMIRDAGGIRLIINLFSKRLKGSRSAELVIASLVSLCNLCTANNTIAIITAAPIAKELSSKFDIAPRRAASLLDTFSCFVQGLLPYGAQLLMASSLSGVPTLAIIPHMYYNFLIGGVALITILVRKKK